MTNSANKSAVRKSIRKSIRIGGASGFWGDSSVGAPQLVQLGKVDYVVFDYLAELTMSVLAAARLKNAELGYATDFVSVTMKAILKDVVAKNIKIVSNAGGMNPHACAAALAAIAAEQGVSIRIAVVEGDDVLPLIPDLRETGIKELQSGQPLPERLLSANAYLGAAPIKHALDAGAQVVITGRCVDSAVTLGVLMHEFDWGFDDFDKLAQGSLAGHLIECGCQATGGLHTDWQTVPDWDNIGYPVLMCSFDGTFTVEKPPQTGGLVSVATVAEQLVYEIGDPANYLLPDVVCDFTQVQLEQVGEHQVSVKGARGKTPTPHYKVSATYAHGFRCSGQLTIVGIDAVAKAQRTGEAILTRTRRLLAEAGLKDYSDTIIEILGAESCYGVHKNAQVQTSREAVLRLTVTHSSKDALNLFAREIAPAGTSWSPGTTGAGGRPSPSPMIRQYAFLLDKTTLQPAVVMDGETKLVEIAIHQTPVGVDTPISVRPEPVEGLQGDAITVPLIQLAYARSGDKGDTSNIGIIARQPALLPYIKAAVTEKAVAAWLAHLVEGKVTRFDLPGIHAVNFVCEQALGGGGMSSLRNDPLGKGMAQMVLDMPVQIPAKLL
ncbi:MAG: acyclic terpene utilization AtuA family protein [Burkholderiaceae bacterium]